MTEASEAMVVSSRVMKQNCLFLPSLLCHLAALILTSVTVELGLFIEK